MMTKVEFMEYALLSPYLIKLMRMFLCCSPTLGQLMLYAF